MPLIRVLFFIWLFHVPSLEGSAMQEMLVTINFYTSCARLYIYLLKHLSDST